MNNWEAEAFDAIINNGFFSITEPGPLHTPIRSFSISRNEKLELILETVCPFDATSSEIEHPAGTLRINNEVIELTDPTGVRARAIGVIPFNHSKSFSHRTGLGELREQAKVHYVETTLRDDVEVAYTIDWLENVEAREFLWPDIIKDKKEVSETRTIGRDGEVTMHNTDEEFSTGRGCVALSVAGTTLYLCTSRTVSKGEASRPGYIVYVGAPDEDTRRKIRTTLSFCLDVYLVYLGTTTFNNEWHTIYIKSISAYSIGRRVFELPVLPPAPLGYQYERQITSLALSRMVNGIYAQHDDLKFDTLSWIYWHAKCATMQTAAADFGGAIEGLQRNYVTAHPEDIETKLITDPKLWKILSREFHQAISRLDVAAENKEILANRVGILNDVPATEALRRLLAKINLGFGSDESRAWGQRNRAAHGREIEDEDRHQAIRDTNLLRGLLRRMLLRITNASDTYHDYSTLGFPTRNLSEPPSST